VIWPLTTTTTRGCAGRCGCFWGAGSSYKLAAEELGSHFNTVKYRVGRAVARRGREIGADRLDVELALLVCHWYGRPVLRTD
jgi:DNA-binding PucR family transcriptional regulator